jgi:hypothetical protein
MMQPYSDSMVLATSQLGFYPASVKKVTLIPATDPSQLPDEIPFFIQHLGDRKKRVQPITEGWDPGIFRWPFFIAKGKYDTSVQDNYLSFHPQPAYTGSLKKITTAWGTFWQGDYTDFSDIGLYQIETEYAFTTPFIIDNNPYEHFIRSYLVYIFSQRSGYEIPGLSEALHLDDAVLDVSGKQIDASGGWYDAGDYRKWVSLTINNLEALVHISQSSHPYFKEKALDEIKWGNKFFHSMINEEGQVYEDVGGGDLHKGYDYENGWWNENHPGVIATGTGNVITDNIINSGDERKVRTTYNPWVQFAFVTNQVLAASAKSSEDSKQCFSLAEKAWKYGNTRGHNQRTLFVAAQLRAAIELYISRSLLISVEEIRKLTENLIRRMDKGNDGLSHYFLEKDNADGFRSIVYSCDPAMALLRLCEARIPGLMDITKEASELLQSHLNHYLVKDASSNPFSLTPYGIYVNPVYKKQQLFRDAGRGRYVRSFIHPLNYQGMVHGTNSVTMYQAFLLARAGCFFNDKKYIKHSELLIQWVTGHNPYGICCFSGMGFKHPVMISFVRYKIPEAATVGFIGNTDDTPYIETSNAVEWSTMEIWDVPFYYAVSAVQFIKSFYSKTFN